MQRSEGSGNSDLQDAEASYGRATKAELAKQYNQAFQHYLKAADLYLHLSRSAGTASKDKSKWKANAQKALERATRIKAFAEKSTKPTGSLGERVPSGPDPATDVRLAPVATNHFAPHELYRVLKKGGHVNGLYFPLWDESTEDTPQEQPFLDPDGEPTFSPEQSAVSAVWRRTDLQPGGTEPAHILPQDIYQHVITDCSVCASVSVCLEHSKRFGTHRRRFTTIAILKTLLNLHPFLICIGMNVMDAWTSNSCSMEHGEELVSRPEINAIPSCNTFLEVIDDQLPYDPQKGTLMCMSTLSSNPSRSRLWPSLLEKAYMKLMGGYDFPGSNSCIDLHAIAGFIPEHIEIRRSDFERERTWDRVSSGFYSGRCMVTLGTGPNPTSMDENVKLLPSHSYAVTDVYEGEEGRMITILDSWVCPKTNAEERSRVLSVPWADALNMFEGIYISWDPAIWKHSLTFHGSWKRSDPEDVSKQLYVIFTNLSSTDEEVWVLLTRHTADTRRTQDFIALQVQVEDDRQSTTALSRQSLCIKETYTNSTHILVRTRLSSTERAGILSILASYDGDANEVGFTVSVYSPEHVDIKWNETVVSPPYTTKVSGTITHKTAGGNCTNRTFMVNPQYHLRILPSRKPLAANVKARTNLSLHSSKDTPVNVAIVWSQGKRVTELPEQDVIASSGAYTYGSARVSKDMPPGDSTIVVSAFDTQYLGPFTLKVECTFPFDLIPIPQEGAGMYSKTIRGSWDRNTAGGSPSFPSYNKNPIYELDVPALTQCIIRLQPAQTSTSPRLNVTIYPASDATVVKPSDASALRFPPHIATSGAYDDGLAGVAIPQTTLSPGRYWVVPSTYKPGVEVEFRLMCYFSVAGVKVVERG